MSDELARTESLHTGRDILLQAPAGSGKTTVLAQRFLAALAQVQEPEQVLAITSNSGMSVLDGVERPIKQGDIVIVPPGVKHNIVNGPGEAMKIITTYIPPNHIDGTIHKTKADAIADVKDEAFGESVA